MEDRYFLYINKNIIIMKCPFCNLEKRGNHIYLCNLRPSTLTKSELREKYIIYNFPDMLDLHNIYINMKMSLPEINIKYGIDYNSIKFLLKFYNIDSRSYSESYKIANKKREETNIERYGAKNVLCKGTEKYNKKQKTIKDRYGVDNIFQCKHIIERINNDQYYIDKYGMTKKDLCSLNSKIRWSSLSDEDKLKFLERVNYLRNDTWLNKYGGHPINNDEIRSKIIETNRLKYGCDYYFQSIIFLNNKDIKDKVKQTRIKNGYEISDDLLKPFELYKKKCRFLTNKIRKELFDNWDGYDYYDGEYIKEYFSLKNTDKRYQ